MILIDRGKGTLRWMVERVFLAVILSIPLILVLGHGAAIPIGMLLIVGLSTEMTLRLRGLVGTPFSFCLPGFRESLRKRYFVAAVLLGLGTSTVPLHVGVFLRSLHPYAVDRNVIEVCLPMAAGFLSGMVACLILGAPHIVLPRLPWGIMLLLAISLPIVATRVFSLFMEHPLVGISLSAVASVFIWLRLGDMARVKQMHRTTLEDAKKGQGQAGVTKTAAPWVESLFQQWMERREYLDVGRYIRGSLYRTFGLVFTYWKWVLASIVGGALVLGYAGGLMAKVVFVGLGVVVQGIYLPIAFDDMLLPAGRRERCYATIATVAAACLLLLATAGAVTFLSWLFSPLMPDLFGGQDGGLHYAPINAADISLSCLLVPWFFAVRLFAYRFAFAETIAGWGFVTGIILLIFFGSKGWLERIDAVLIAGAFICGWAFFLLALWRVRVRGPLAELSLADG